MPEERVQRRLAAILAADVVGYSRLMERDEPGTLAALIERRKTVLEPLIARHEGRVVKIMGDGVLRFGSSWWRPWAPRHRRCSAGQYCGSSARRGERAAHGEKLDWYRPRNQRLGSGTLNSVGVTWAWHRVVAIAARGKSSAKGVAS
jgi:hypothetical protein